MNDPTIIWVRAFLGLHTARLRAAWTEGDRGASAVELAVITAVLVLIAIVILVAIKHFVNKQKTTLSNAPVPNG